MQDERAVLVENEARLLCEFADGIRQLAREREGARMAESAEES